MAIRVAAPAPQFVGPTFTLIACDWSTPLAVIDTFESATIIARHNDVSTWDLTLPADTDAAAVLLASSRPRVLFSNGANVYRSGPVVRLDRQANDEGDVEMLVVTGVDDLVWLRRRLAHPQPGTAAPPYSTTAYDTRTGAASQVVAGYVDRNAGAAAVAARQVPGLVVAPPAAFGGTVTVNARYDNLLEFVQGIANAAGIGFRVRDLAFEVFTPTGAAVFSVDLGTLAGWEGIVEAPDLTYVYVAGQGEGTARTIREYADAAGLAAWGRIEGFRDRRDTNDAATMDQAGAETLAEAAKPPIVDMESVDTPSQAFLTDWNVGDTAVVVIGSTTITDVIVEAEITLEPNAPAIVRPALGGSPVDLAQWRAVNLTNRRLRQLERI